MYRISQGGESALVALMERHKQAVFHFVYRLLENEADSVEVTEEAFFRVYQSSGRYTKKASVKTWIFTIALNLAKDRLQKNKKYRNNISLELVTTKDDTGNSRINRVDSGEPSPAEVAKSENDLKIVRQFISKLPGKLKFPFVFCVLEGNSYDECAEVLQTNRKAVETRIYRARNILKDQLTNFFEKP